jgi:hypothetical protein
VNLTYLICAQIVYDAVLSAKLASGLSNGKKKIALNTTYYADLGSDPDDWWQVEKWGLNGD